MNWVYMIKNSYGDLYIGITTNPHSRLEYHNAKHGALFTKRQSKFQIVFLEKYPSLAQARKREIQLKKWRRDKKDVLINRYQSRLETKNLVIRDRLITFTINTGKSNLQKETS